MANRISNYLISQLIYKYITEDISEDEQKVLNQWRSEPANEQLFLSITDEEALADKIHIYNSLNSHKAFKQVNSRINAGKSRRLNIYQKSWRYAAAAAFLICASYFFFKEDFIGAEENMPISVQPGSHKAILILGDGQKVDLSLDSTIIDLNGLAIKNENNQLSYLHLDNKSQKSGTAEVAFNTLVIPVGGQYKVQLPDGSFVWLNSTSSLRYPVEFSGNERIVYLEGEAYFDVKKDFKPFIVHTQNVEVSVLGTQFNISAYKDDADIVTTLVEGKVAVRRNNFKNSLVLMPGQQAVYSLRVGSIVTNNVDTEIYTAWKDGKFYFDEEQLESILTKLARWYSISVEYEHEDLRNKEFTGVVLKDKPLEYILNYISKTTDISYKIENHKLTIMKKQTP